MRICCITHHQLVNNPRIVREADALALAGHEVRVISVRQTPVYSCQDRELASRKAWKWQTINIEKTPAGFVLWFWTGLRKKISKRLRTFFRSERLAGYAYTRTYFETIRKIVQEPTDLVIAHTQPMLAPAFAASKKISCRWGFDCEDILSEEIGEGIKDLDHQALVRYVEKKYIPKAAYITTASPAFVDWLKEHISASSVTTVNNVPSLSEAPAKIQAGYKVSRPHLSLYWFSQSIGPGRGIEDALQALPYIQAPVLLHLRGDFVKGYREILKNLLRKLHIEDKVVFHGRVAPETLIKATAEHDIGLALEQTECLNRELCVSNKIFSYFMAGLAVIATSTKGQMNVLKEAQGTAWGYTPGDFKELAYQINFLAEKPDELYEIRKRAFGLAKSRFNWENEQKKLIQVIEELPSQ